MISPSFGRSASFLNVCQVVEHARDELNCNHLILFLRIWDALVILTALKCKLLLVPILLLLDQILYVLATVHLLGVVEIGSILLVVLPVFLFDSDMPDETLFLGSFLALP